MAVTHLVFGGVLDEFPRLKVCVPHGGGTTPFLAGKLSRLIGSTHGSDITQGSAIKAKRPLEEYLHRNFYFDTFVEDPRSLQLVVDVMGPDRVLFGQHTGLASTTASELDHVRRLNIGSRDKEKILGENARQLFKLG